MRRWNCKYKFEYHGRFKPEIISKSEIIKGETLEEAMANARLENCFDIEIGEEIFCYMFTGEDEPKKADVTEDKREENARLARMYGKGSVRPHRTHKEGEHRNEGSCSSNGSFEPYMKRRRR